MDNPDKAERHAKWRILVEEHEKSGLSQREFCMQHSLVVSQFNYYRTQFKAQQPSKNINELMPIQLQKNSSGSNEIRLLLPNGLQCILPSQLDVIQIRRLVEVLLSC